MTLVNNVPKNPFKILLNKQGVPQIVCFHLPNKSSNQILLFRDNIFNYVIRVREKLEFLDIQETK